MLIKTDGTKQRIIDNEFEKVREEKQEKLREVGIDRLIPLKNKSKAEIIDDMDKMISQADDEMRRSKERSEKIKRLKQRQKPMMSEDKYQKILLDRKRREFEKRRINL